MPAQRDRPTSDLCFSKVGSLAFIAMVINCIAEMECESQKIDVMVAAEKMYLGIQDLTSEELQGVLRGGVPSSRAVGMVQEQIVSK